MVEVPVDLDRKQVGELLRGARSVRGVPARLEWVSRQWLGRPYRDSPLVGSSEEAEVFTASLDSFDCVTYVESVLALAVSNSVSQFVQNLRLIRYRGGRVGWRTRNHYMSGWIRQNTGAGFVRNQTRGRTLARRDRRLNVVAGLPERTVSVSSIPKSEFCRRFGEVETGDLIFFASTRKNLDIFHCGVLIRSGGDVVMRHAARSRGGVVEQSLRQFLKANRMVGVIVVRPEDAFPRAA